LKKGGCTSDLEQIRRRFRPKPIRTLFVCESPPHQGTFFYKKDSLLYRKMKECFSDMADFLEEFKTKGFFLDDLVLYPINQMDNKQRNEHRRKGISLLARRIADYQPAAVVVLMCGIEPMVVDAMREVGLSDAPHYTTPFPRPEHQKRFKEKWLRSFRNCPSRSVQDEIILLDRLVYVWYLTLL
jgi:hypothetical protein